jgi:hypothetical protein
VSVRLLLVMLNLVFEDGPSVYGGVITAVDAINQLVDKEGINSVKLSQIDSILREHNVNVALIEETYSRRD